VLDGALTFARFAYPPNELGYCGPDASRELLERIDANASGPELRALAMAFEGAWPYLELIAAANAISDPLDSRVVEAYWIGNELLERVDLRLLAASLIARFHSWTGRACDRMLEPLRTGARPNHGFHVFGVYPWVGLLRGGRVDEPLRVLDRCRIRWGRVESVEPNTVTVTSRPLGWDGRRLVLGASRSEPVVSGRDGHRLARDPRPGDWWALHWDWLCLPLTRSQLHALRHYTGLQLAAVNAVPYPAPAAVLA
jgi:hypothetical protein